MNSQKARRTLSWLKTAGVAAVLLVCCGEALRGAQTGDTGLNHPVFDEFAEWHRKHKEVAEGARAKLAEEGREIARNRRKALKQLIQSNPKHALAVAVSPEEKKKLPASVARELETVFTAYGDYEVLVTVPTGTNRPASALVERYLIVEGVRYKAFVYGRQSAEQTRRNLAVYGVRLDEVVALHEEPFRIPEATSLTAPANPFCTVSGSNALAAATAEYGGELHSFCTTAHLEENLKQLKVSKAASAGDVPEPSPWTQGTKQLLFIQVNFPDDLQQPASGYDISYALNQMNEFFVRNSYRKVSVTATVTPLLTLPFSTSYYSANGAALLTDARLVAAANGWDTANYELDCVFSKPVGHGSRAYVGFKGAWIDYLDWRVVAHELGHNFGLWHANSWEAKADSIIGPGQNIEYGNYLDMMGTLGGDFNVCHKNLLDWLPNQVVRTVTSNGVYRLYPFQLVDPTNQLTLALKTTKDAEKSCWMEWRQAGYFTMEQGIYLNWSPWSQSAGGTHLLDMHPQTAAWGDYQLYFGETFSDREAGVHITPLGTNPTTPPSIDVAIRLGQFAGNRAPVLSLSASASNVPVQTAIDLSAQVSDPDGDLTVLFWDFGDGQFTSSTGAVSKSWVAAGDYVVRCSASDFKGKVTTASLVVRVGTVVTFQVRGRVLHNGQGLEGVKIRGSNNLTVVTASDGSYTLTGLPSGDYALVASKPFFQFTPAGILVTVSNQHATAIDFVGQSNGVLNLPAYVELSGSFQDLSNNFSGLYDGMAVAVGSTLTMDAWVINDSTNYTVYFYDNGAFLGTGTNYFGYSRFEVASLAAGKHQVQAVVVDELGVNVVSVPIDFTVIAQAPANDRFASRAPIHALPFTSETDNLKAGAEPGELFHSGFLATQSLWWSWSPPSDGLYVLEAEGVNVVPRLAVYTGNALTNLAQVDTAYGNAAPNHSRVLLDGKAGTLYSIALDTYSPGGALRLSLRAAAPPANDAYANRLVLTGSNLVVSASNVDATGEPGEPLFAGAGRQSSVWWDWTPPFSGRYVFSLQGPFWNEFRIYTGSSLTNLLLVDAAFSYGFGESRTVFHATAGTTYRLQVNGNGGSSGPFTLAIQKLPAPFNDDFSNRLPLTGLPAQATGSNVDASREPGEPYHDFSSAGASVWWAWTAPASGRYHVSTEGSSFPTVLAVYTGNKVSELSQVAVAPPYYGSNVASKASFLALEGVSYAIVVDGMYSLSSGPTGQVQLQLWADAPALVNSWTKPGSGNWEENQWSLGVLPATTQPLVCLTNAGFKAVAIGPQTPLQYPASLSLSNLMLSGPTNSLNTLFLNYAGLDEPLRIWDTLLVQTNARVLLYYSSLRVGDSGSGGLLLGGKIQQAEGSEAVYRRAEIGYGHAGEYELTNGAVAAGWMRIGKAAPGSFLQIGGHCSISQGLELGNAGSSYTMNNGTLQTYSGTIGGGAGNQAARFEQRSGNSVFTNGLTLGAYGDETGAGMATLSGGSLAVYDLSLYRGTFNQQGGAGFCTYLDVEGSPSGDAVYNLAGGTLSSSYGYVGYFGNGTFNQNGGLHFVSNSMSIYGNYPKSGRYHLNAGRLISFQLNVSQNGSFFQNGGTNETRGELWLLNGGTYQLSGGHLRNSHATIETYYSLSTSSSFALLSGTHIVSNALRINYAGYTLSGGNLTASNIYLRYSTLSCPGGAISNPGQITFYDGGTFAAGGRNHQLGQIAVEGRDCHLDLSGGASLLRFRASSNVFWSSAGLLYIDHWAGSASGGGFHRVFCGTNGSGLHLQQLDHIAFRNPAGFPPGTYLAKILPSGEIVPKQQPTLTYYRVGTDWVFSWPEGFQLEGATNVAGPYEVIWGASSPFTNSTTTEPQRFFRIYRF